MCVHSTHLPSVHTYTYIYIRTNRALREVQPRERPDQDIGNNVCWYFNMGFGENSSLKQKPFQCQILVVHNDRETVVGRAYVCTRDSGVVVNSFSSVGV